MVTIDKQSVRISLPYGMIGLLTILILVLNNYRKKPDAKTLSKDDIIEDLQS